MLRKTIETTGWLSNEVLDKITSPIRLHRSKIFSIFFRKFFKVFRKLFDCLVISKFFSEIGRVETIHLVRKSSNFESSLRFFGRLKKIANFDSIDSIFCSIRSILCPRAYNSWLCTLPCHNDPSNRRSVHHDDRRHHLR